MQRAYADWRRYPQYIVPLAESSIDMILAPAYGSSKKNATDIRLAVDAIELVFTRPEIGTYILLSGDSDFASLVIKLKEYGKYVIGVGIRESSSDLLVMNCDEYYSYNALAGLVKNERRGARAKWDPWELVTEADQPHEAQRRRHALRPPQAGHAGDRQHVRREGSRHVEVLALRAGRRAARAALRRRSSRTASSRSACRAAPRATPRAAENAAADEAARGDGDRRRRGPQARRSAAAVAVAAVVA